jgi:hypothetical protein
MGSDILRSGAGRLCARLWTQLRRFHDEQVETHQRLWLLNNPWEEDFLHWAADGTLHGTRAPLPGRRRGVTKGGWCIGLRDRHIDDPLLPPSSPR